MTSTKNTTAWAEVDEQGRLVVPAEVAAKYGLQAGARVRLDDRAGYPCRWRRGYYRLIVTR